MISAATAEDTELFHKALGYNPSSDFKGIKYEVGGEIWAMAGYDYWTLNSVQMHIWIPNPKSLQRREFIREAFRYPFEIGNRGLAIGVTPAHNSASLKFQKALGFVEKYRIQDGWAIGDDMVITELKRQDCVWLRPVYVPDSSHEHDSRSARGAG